MDGEVARIFEQFGKVLSYYSVKFPNGLSKGFGFLEFVDRGVAGEVARRGRVAFRGKFLGVKWFRNTSEKGDSGGLGDGFEGGEGAGEAGCGDGSGFGGGYDAEEVDFGGGGFVGEGAVEGDWRGSEPDLRTQSFVKKDIYGFVDFKRTKNRKKLKKDQNFKIFQNDFSGDFEGRSGYSADFTDARLASMVGRAAQRKDDYRNLLFEIHPDFWAEGAREEEKRSRMVEVMASNDLKTKIYTQKWTFRNLRQNPVVLKK